MAKTERLQIRIDPEQKERLKELAAAENRSMSNYVEMLVQKAIDQQPKKHIERSCRNCRRVCIGNDGTYTDIEGGCEHWEQKRGK